MGAKVPLGRTLQGGHCTTLYDIVRQCTTMYDKGLGEGQGPGGSVGGRGYGDRGLKSDF